MKRITALILAFIIILVTFASCGGDDSMEIYYPVVEDFTSLDPQIASDTSSMIIDYNCYEGLVRENQNGKIVAAGAESWDVSSDSKIYTFHLRKDAKWYLTNTSKEAFSNEDGTENLLPADFDDSVTAKDYVFGLQRAVSPETGAADGSNLSAIKNASEILNGTLSANELGVKAIDNYTLEITLQHADPDFLYYLTRLVSMPCNETFFNACKGRYGLAMEYMLCNGVYMVYRWTAESLIRMEKNPLYNGTDKSICDRVWVYYVEDDTTVADKIKGGTYDAGYVSAEAAPEFTEKKSFTVQSTENVMWGYWFNNRSSSFAVTDMRIAFASATDRGLITAPEYISGNADRLLTNTMTPQYDYVPQLIKYDEDSAETYYKSAIAKSENITASMTVTVLTCDEMAESVKKQIQIWQRVFGIDVKIKTDTRENVRNMFYSGNYEVAFLPVAIDSTNTSEFYRTFSSDSAYNYTGYTNGNYDALINSVTYSMTDEQKADVYKSCEQSLISYAVVIPEFTESSYFVQGKGVSGIYSFSESEVYFRFGNIT